MRLDSQLGRSIGNDKNMVAQPGLIVNADDLGIHPRIDAGIFDTFERGILTSATMLVTTPFAGATAGEARRRGLPVGLHVSLTLGRAVAPWDKVPDLVDREGNLRLSAAKLLLLGSRDGHNRSVYQQITREIDAQFASARSYGLSLTHVDSHQHVHMNPYIFEIVEVSAERHGVRCIRMCREPFYLFELGADLVANLRRLNPAKLALARLLQRRITPRLKTNDYFFGLMYSGRVTASALRRLLARIARSDGTYEIGLHPGYCAPPGESFYPQPGYNEFISSPSREAECRLLMEAEVKSLIHEHRIRLMSYGDLA